MGWAGFSGCWGHSQGLTGFKYPAVTTCSGRGWVYAPPSAVQLPAAMVSARAFHFSPPSVGGVLGACCPGGAVCRPVLTQAQAGPVFPGEGMRLFQWPSPPPGVGAVSLVRLGTVSCPLTAVEGISFPFLPPSIDFHLYPDKAFVREERSVRHLCTTCVPRPVHCGRLSGLPLCARSFFS